AGRGVGIDKRSAVPHTVGHATPGGALSADYADVALGHRVSTPAIGGLHSGEFCAIWLGPEMPDDQRADDALARCYDTAPLDAPLAVVGRPRVRLRLSSDQPLAQVAVRLCDVQPDGASSRVSYGVLNLCQRDDHATHRPMPVGETVEVTVELNHCALEFAAGNGLRVAVSTDYWPLLWPMPEPVELTIEALSIDLPGLPESHARDVVFELPESATSWQHEVLREPDHTRRVEHDLITQTVTLVIEDDFGEMRDASHGLVKGGVGRERWSIDPANPLSAVGETHWTQTLARDDWSIRTETRLRMTADATQYHLSGEIEAFEGDDRVLHRELSQTLSRFA
ncbi:MAG: CocE/NonD family hydrolase, partial [Pseudomonadota bacterium]